jgi:DNA-binding transcriptional regulator YhcF (GntR family)
MPQHEPVPAEEILAYANTADKEGNLPSRIDIAAKFGINVVTVNKVLLADPNHDRTPKVKEKERTEGNLVLEELRKQTLENGWAPSQRDIAEATGLMVSRVNYLLQVMKHQGLIEIGPHPRQVRITGSKMVIPQVTM